MTDHPPATPSTASGISSIPFPELDCDWAPGHPGLEGALSCQA